MDIEGIKRLERQKRDIEDYQLEEGEGIEGELRLGVLGLVGLGDNVDLC